VHQLKDKLLSGFLEMLLHHVLNWNSKRICPVLKGGNKISNLALKGEEMDLDAKYLS